MSSAAGSSSSWSPSAPSLRPPAASPSKWSATTGGRSGEHLEDRERAEGGGGLVDYFPRLCPVFVAHGFSPCGGQ